MSGVISDALDQEQIDLLLSLDDGAGEVLEEIVAEFLVMGVELRSQIAAALEANDGPTAQRLAHTLKGASANVGAAALAGVCASIEAQVRVRGVAVDDINHELEDAFDRACMALKTLNPEG